MNRIYKKVIKECGECPNLIPDDTDEAHGCLYTPPSCSLTKKSLIPSKVDDRSSIPEWCPLPKEKSKCHKRKLIN